ncbi:hypothetical protein ACI65C_009371 [Semiaphis heraclei]
MTKKKTSKQLTKKSSKKKLYTSSYDNYEKIMIENKIRVTKPKKDKSSVPTSNVNGLEDDKKLLKTQRINIKKNKEKDSKVHYINNLKNDNTATPSEKRAYSKIDECCVLLSDCNEHKKKHKSHNASTINNTKNSSENDKDYSSILKTQGKKIKKIDKKGFKAQSINNFKNDNAAVPTDRRHSQLKECFILLSDFNKQQNNHKSHMDSTSNNTKISSENDNEYSSILKTKEQNIKKVKKRNSKVQNINNLINDNTVVHKKKRHYSQIKESFVLLSDCNEHKKNYKTNKSSSSSNKKISSENDKDYSSILKTQGKKIKKMNKYKVLKRNNLEDDNAAIHTEKRHCIQLKECFVLLSDFNEHKKIHNPLKFSTSSNTKICSENDKDYSSILKTRGKKIKKMNKYKVQKINSLENDNAAIHTEKRHCMQLKECFVLLSDFNEHKQNHKPRKDKERKDKTRF